MRALVLLMLLLLLVPPALAQPEGKTWAWFVVRRDNHEDRLAGPFYSPTDCEAAARTFPAAVCVQRRD